LTKLRDDLTSKFTMSRDRTVPDIRKAERIINTVTSKLKVFFRSLRDRANSVIRRAHLGDDLIEPLKGAIEMNFDPTRS